MLTRRTLHGELSFLHAASGNARIATVDATAVEIELEAVELQVESDSPDVGASMEPLSGRIAGELDRWCEQLLPPGTPPVQGVSGMGQPVRQWASDPEWSSPFCVNLR